jgi:dTDP-4-dehydrorhamnose 3,5-epimerase
VQLLIPQGCAHGYQTLTDDADLLYLVSASYDPQRERGLRWNDAEIGIAWPMPVTEMSPRDQQLPGWRDQPPWGDAEAKA